MGRSDSLYLLRDMVEYDEGFVEVVTKKQIKNQLKREKGSQHNHIFIFDNYGNLVTEESDFATLKNLNKYVYSMDKYDCTRSFYYTDILATTKKNYVSVKNAIDEYKINFINKKY